MLSAMLLATVFCHGMFPVVVTLGFFLNASIFYPSKKIRCMVEDGIPMDESIVLLYY